MSEITYLFVLAIVFVAFNEVIKNIKTAVTDFIFLATSVPLIFIKSSDSKP